MSYRSLRVERRGPVGWLIFHRPERRNALGSEMRAELPSAWTELDRDPAVHVIVCTGSGDAFSSGLDLADLADPALAELFRADVADPARARYTARDNSVRKPVIAAVNGLCVGGAMMWVVDADLAIASSTASFVDPHTTIGQVVGRASWGATHLVPFQSAMRMVLLGTGERLDAWQALSAGLVTEVVDPPVDLEAVAQELAEKIARNSPAALAATKRAMWRSLQLGLDDACRAATAEITSLWEHPDQAEGPAAFAERRDPRWSPLPP